MSGGDVRVHAGVAEGRAGKLDKGRHFAGGSVVVIAVPSAWSAAETPPDDLPRHLAQKVIIGERPPWLAVPRAVGIVSLSTRYPIVSLTGFRRLLLRELDKPGRHDGGNVTTFDRRLEMPASKLLRQECEAGKGHWLKYCAEWGLVPEWWGTETTTSGVLRPSGWPTRGPRRTSPGPDLSDPNFDDDWEPSQAVKAPPVLGRYSIDDVGRRASGTPGAVTARDQRDLRILIAGAYAIASGQTVADAAREDGLTAGAFKKAYARALERRCYAVGRVRTRLAGRPDPFAWPRGRPRKGDKSFMKGRGGPASSV